VCTGGCWGEGAVGEGHFTVALSPTRRFQVHHPVHDSAGAGGQRITRVVSASARCGGIAGVGVEVLSGSWGSRALTNGRAWVAHDHR
jgi:hypothetical protein